MRVLNFEVYGQNLKKIGDFSGIVSGTKGYLKCHANFADNDWKRALKVAVFDETYLVPMYDDSCMVPYEVSDKRSFKMSIVGKNGDMVIKTNQVLIEQVV